MRLSISLPLVGALVLAGAAAAVAPAGAQQDPIAERQAIMKDNGRQSRTINQMIKGEAPFDAAVALQAFQEMNAGAKRFGALFPEGTETGGDTEAAPAIWERPDEFQAAVAKFEADTAAALASPPQDLAALQTTFQTVGGNCRSCHEAFRIDR